MRREFIETPSFSKKWFSLGFDDEDLAELQKFLINNPTAGKVMVGTGGLKKIRFAFEGTVKPPKTHAKTARPATRGYLGSDYDPPKMLAGPPEGTPKQLTGPGWGDKFVEPPSVIEL